jgi:hypothetical protein
MATYTLWVIRRVDSCTIEQEAHAARALALTLTERVHELLELSCALDLEEDLVVGVGDFDVQVLGLRLRGVLLVAGGRVGRSGVRHGRRSGVETRFVVEGVDAKRSRKFVGLREVGRRLTQLCA